MLHSVWLKWDRPYGAISKFLDIALCQFVYLMRPILQFGTHLYPLLYSFLLVAIVYHAFVTLFLDYSGSYEERARRWLPVRLQCCSL